MRLACQRHHSAGYDYTMPAPQALSALDAENDPRAVTMFARYGDFLVGLFSRRGPACSDNSAVSQNDPLGRPCLSGLIKIAFIKLCAAYG
jgi:hypothetical protein